MNASDTLASLGFGFGWDWVRGTSPFLQDPFLRAACYCLKHKALELLVTA